MKLNIKSSKKGNLLDFTEVGVFMISALMVGYIIYSVLGGFSTSLEEGNVTETNYSSFIDDASNKTTTSLDWAVLIFLLAALIFSIIMAKRINVDPLYMALVIFLSVLFFLVAMVISNVFGGLMDNVSLATYMNLRMPITKILLRYFPFITLIYEAIVIYFLFNKNEFR